MRSLPSLIFYFGLLAKKFGSTVGGLFLAFPAIFPASATLIESTSGSALLLLALIPQSPTSG
jgi:hypothetical protein